MSFGATMNIDTGHESDPTLAHEGGAPVRRDPFPPWPAFGKEEIEAVSAVLRSGKVNAWTGQEVRSFEQEFAQFVEARHAVAVANGTLALELALAAVGIGPGDDVIVTCRSFVASASCCAMRGAKPVFADVDPESQNVTAETIRQALTPNTKAIIAVHLAGWPCEMDPIMELAQDRGLAVIEDCAQAHGATYRGRPVGSLGHAAAFSFCQDKILTTGGEGGMLTTNDEAIWERAWSFKDHGKSWQAVNRPNHATVFKWLHASIGTNWRMTEMQAAIGRVLLRKLPDWLQRRRRHAAALTQHFCRVPALRLTVPPIHVRHSYYKYYAFLRPELLRPGWSRDRIVRAIQAEGIPCGSGVCPEIYLEGAFEASPSRPPERFPVAKRLGETSLMFVVHPTLSEGDMVETCRAAEKVLKVATTGDSREGRRAA
jgi:dTDP-4-amino-4,6-dideoxygalactose transaminase